MPSARILKPLARIEFPPPLRGGPTSYDQRRARLRRVSTNKITDKAEGVVNLKDKKFYRNTKLKGFAKSLRKNATPEENKLWYRFLRKVRPRFHRQQIIGNYIADFYCPKARLIIEIDGIQHAYDEKTATRDLKKDNYLESNGFEVLRFDNYDIRRRMDWVEVNIIIVLERRLAEVGIESPITIADCED